jgi:hypothetical protein
MSGFILPLAEGESRPARSAAAGGQFGDFLCKAHPLVRTGVEPAGDAENRTELSLKNKCGGIINLTIDLRYSMMTGN